MTAIDVNDLVGKTLQLVRPPTREGEEPAAAGAPAAAPPPPPDVIVTQLDAALPTVQGDAALLKQVLLNLTLNAVEAMREGDKLTVRPRRAAEGGGATSAGPTAA